MRTYEALYIVRPDREDDAVQTIADGVTQLITSNGGAIVRSEIWGKRRLAYVVKKYTEGVFVLVRFQSNSSFVIKLKNHFRLSEDIVRFLVVYMDERSLRLEAEQEERNKAQLEARTVAGRTRTEEDEDEDEDGPRRRSPRGGRRRVEDDEPEFAER